VAMTQSLLRRKARPRASATDPKTTQPKREPRARARGSGRKEK